MMQEEKVLCHGQTVYFPKAAYRYFAIVTTMLSVLGLMCLGGLLFNQENFTLSPAAFFLLYSVCCTLLTKVLYDAARQGASCTEKGLILLNDRGVPMDFLTWAELPCVCEAMDRKENRYLVLSKEPLSPQQASRLANKSENSMRMHVEDSIVLRNTGTKAAADFFEELKAFRVTSQSCQ